MKVDLASLQSKVLRFCHYDDDLAQDVMLKLLSSPQYQDDGKLDHWLSRVCSNARKNHLKQQKPTCELSDNFSEPFDAEDVDWELLTNEERYICTKLVEGYSIKEIAEQQNINPSTLRSQLCRLRKKRSN